MFTKPINIPMPQTEIKQRPRKKWFNGYVLCFLFIILSILLILAYRIEVKIVQQNLKKNYEDYIEELKKGFIDEENLLILAKNNYDIKTNGEDYEVINVILDDGTQFSKTKKASSSSVVPSSTASAITSSVDSGEVTENHASERTSSEKGISTNVDDSMESYSSEEYDVNTSKSTTISKVNATVSTSKTGKDTTKPSQNNTSAKSTGKPTTQKSTTTQTVKVSEYITKLSNVNKTVAPTAGDKIKVKEYYEPKRPGIVVVQVNEDADYPDIHSPPTTDKNKKYYHLPKEMFGNIGDITSKKTTTYQDDSSDEDLTESQESEENEESNTEDSISEMEKVVRYHINNGGQNEDPPNENINSFQKNFDDVNKLIGQIHKEISQQINKDLSDMQKEMAPMNFDLDLDIDPFHDRQVKPTPKNLGRANKANIVLDEPIVE